MSDRPHRSLPMRRGWKKVAECADNTAYQAQEIANALGRAIEDDWHVEVPDPLLRKLSIFCGDRQPSFLEDYRASEIAALRRDFAGFGSLGGVLIDCVQQALAGGKGGEDALRDGVLNASAERALRNIRQVEEHYHRWSHSRSENIRARLEEATGQAPLDGIVTRAMKPQPASAVRPRKQAGLDDGVPLP
jgi:hypothetical protein